MIYSFTVENFRSIGNRQTISFATTADKKYRDLMSVEVKPNVYINKLGIFYGANASGKSNMINAIACLFIMMAVPREKQNMKTSSYIPFALYNNRPTYFEITFFKNGVQYDYKLSYNDQCVINEELYYYPKRGKALFYIRKMAENGTQPIIEFGNTLGLSAKSKQSLKENTYNNHTVISTINKITLTEDASPIIDLYEWLLFNINIDGKSNSMVAELNEVIGNADKKAFYIQMLQKSDFNINDFAIVDKSNSYSQEMLEVIDSLSEDKKISMTKDVVYTSHTINGDFQLPSIMQSAGTLKYTELLDDLYKAMYTDSIYLFDEIGVRLHSDLTEYYLRLFLHNSNQSQMFFTTHNILLLESEFMRRDCVYLTYKDCDTAISEYKRVSDMGLHKNLSLYNAYKQGKLGATPNLGSPYIVHKHQTEC